MAGVIIVLAFFLAHELLPCASSSAIDRTQFPPDFLFGTSTSAYQCPFAPKFSLDLRSNRRPAMPVPARCVEYRPRRWCMLNPISAGDVRAGGRLADNVGYACSCADCTALGYGCSCGALDACGTASYAFNAYYQVHGQVESACDFQGIGVVVHEDASQGACNFSVQLVGSGAPALASVSCVAFT